MRLIDRFRRMSAIVLAAVIGTAMLAAPAPALAAVDAGPAVGRGAARSVVDPDRYLTYRDSDSHYFEWKFSTPRGAVRCTVAQYEDSSPWGCFAVEHTWRDPKLPKGYPTDSCTNTRNRQTGALFTYSRDALFTVLCKGDLPGVTGRSRVLPIGAAITVNGITCTALLQQGREAVRCTAKQGGRFTMSRTRLTFQQSKPL